MSPPAPPSMLAGAQRALQRAHTCIFSARPICPLQQRCPRSPTAPQRKHLSREVTHGGTFLLWHFPPLPRRGWTSSLRLPTCS